MFFYILKSSCNSKYMLKKIAFATAMLFLIGCTPKTAAPTTMDEHMDHGDEMSGIEHDMAASPRHQEWVTVDNNGKTIQVFVVYPEVSEKVPVVLVIHENKGLNDWAKSMADQIAEAGYIAVAPDLLSGFSDTQQRTSDFVDDAAATQALGTLDPSSVMSDLNAVATYAQTIPASNGKLVSAGFCWGGGQSFKLALDNEELDAALVFYGTAPDNSAVFEHIDAPVYGFYGGADERVNATLEQTTGFMAQANNTFDYQIYDGAGHAFMRTGEGLDGEAANIQARNEAWVRLKEILAGI